jgi:hypothetical protein
MNTRERPYYPEYGGCKGEVANKKTNCYCLWHDGCGHVAFIAVGHRFKFGIFQDVLDASVTWDSTVLDDRLKHPARRQ